jgi:hypothetical protein
MTAYVRRIRANGYMWSVDVVRDDDLDIDRDEPPLSDLFQDIRDSLRRWLADTAR